MGDYGYRTCTVCGRDVLWEEAAYMKDEVVCCTKACEELYLRGLEAPISEKGPDSPGK